MEYRSYGKTLVVRLDKGDLIIESLLEVCRREKVLAGSVTGLGAVSRVEYGYFDRQERRIVKREKQEDMEITALVGTLAALDGQPSFHLHITLADSQQHAWGGHLFEGEISVTAEIVISLLEEGAPGRVYSSEAGINILKF